jgi:predicted NAD/FAD-dependent oxidoreductase
MTSTIIIGAGMAGLACARRLVEAGHQPVVLDKGRGVGGRVATRRDDGFQFDHGAQYVTAKDAPFAAVLSGLIASGQAAPWPDASGKPRVVGTPSMRTLAAALATGLDIRQSVTVTALNRGEGDWQVCAGEMISRAERVVVTVPAPQVAALIGPDHPLSALLTRVQMAPCLTLMVSIDAPAPFVTRETLDDPIAWIAQDSAKPGRPPPGAVAWVAHASPEFSAAHLEDSPADMVSRMLPLVCERLGVTADRVAYAAAHRWRYAHVTAPLGQPFLRSADRSLYLAGDWCIGPRVEAAWTSGTAAANDLLVNMA